MVLLLLITLHVVANTIWIGSIVSVGVMLRHASRAETAEAKAQGALARRIYQTIAQPAFAASFLFGGAMLARSVSTYMALHWLHGKLTFALAVIALHHVIGGKAKKVAAGSMQQVRNGAILSGALLLCVLAVVTFAVFRQNLV